jgi:hypothetical protein
VLEKASDEMLLTAKEIALILDALENKYGRGYSRVKEIAVLQGKLSIMAEVACKSEQREPQAENPKPAKR